MKLTVGAAAINRSNFVGEDRTILVRDNPATRSGILSTIKIYMHGVYAAPACKIGTFYGSGNSWTRRDYVARDLSIGLNTLTGLSIDVVAGDLIGVYLPASFSIDLANTGGSGYFSKDGDMFEPNPNTYAPIPDSIISLFGEGPSPPMLITSAATQIMEQSAEGNADIENDGELSITQHGVLWKKGADPVNLAGADAYTQEGAGSEGSFSSTLSPLFEDTLYYYRAYAENSDGTGYGVAQSFITKYRPRCIII